MTDFPQMVVGRKGNPLFQGNRSVGEIFFHLARSMRCFGFSPWEPFSSKILDGALSRLGISYSGLAYEILVTIGVFLHLPLQREFLRVLQVLTVSRMIFPSKNHFCCCRNGPMFQVLTIKSEYYKDHSLIIPEVTGPQ